MTPFHAEITLQNPVHPELAPVQVTCRVDAGAAYLMIPHCVALRLWLFTLDSRVAEAADGRRMKLPYAGPVQLSFEGRSCFAGALIEGEEVVLGAMPLADMELLASLSLPGVAAGFSDAD